MVRRFLRGRVAQELGQRAAVAAPPGNAALRGEALEVTDQDHTEVSAGRDRRAALLIGVVRVAQLLQPGVETGFGQELIQPAVERVAGRLRQVGRSHPSFLLIMSTFAQGHAGFLSHQVRESNSTNCPPLHGKVKETFSTAS